MNVCEPETPHARTRVCVLVSVNACERVCVCVKERGRERKREKERESGVEEVWVIRVCVCV